MSNGTAQYDGWMCGDESWLRGDAGEELSLQISETSTRRRVVLREKTQKVVFEADILVEDDLKPNASTLRAYSIF